MSLKKAALAKNSANKVLRINIAYGVKIRDIFFFNLSFSSILNQF